MRRLVAPAVAVAVTAAGAVFVAIRLATGRTSAIEALGRADPRWLAVATIAAVVAMAAVADAWGRVLCTLGYPLPRRTAMRTFFRGEIGKYAPGGVWAVVGRAEWAARYGVPRRTGYAAVTLSLTANYMACALVAGAFLIAGAEGHRAPVALLLVLPAAGLALHPRVGGWVLARLDLPSLTWRSAAVRMAGFVPAWLLIGLATYATARAVAGDRPVDLQQAFFAAALSWLAGFVAAPAPAGLGVREAVFVATCGLPVGPAAAAALLARLMFVVTDTVGFAVSTPPRPRGRARGR